MSTVEKLVDKLTAEQLLDELLENPEYRKEHDRQMAITKMAQLIHSLRKNAQLTQKQLSELTGIRQATISRLESYENDHLPKIETLQTIAHACGYKLTVSAEMFESLEPVAAEADDACTSITI